MECVYIIRSKVKEKGRKVRTEYFTSEARWHPDVRLARRWADRTRAERRKARKRKQKRGYR